MEKRQKENGSARSLWLGSLLVAIGLMLPISSILARPQSTSEGRAMKEMQVYQKSQNDPAFRCWLANDPHVSFGDNVLTISAQSLEGEKWNDIIFAYDDIDRIELKDATADWESGINAVKGENTLCIAYADASTVIVYGVPTTADVSLCAIDGKPMPQRVEWRQGQVLVHLDHLQTGLYVVSVGKQSFKINKK